MLLQALKPNGRECKWERCNVVQMRFRFQQQLYVTTSVTLNSNRNRKLLISRAPTKAKSQKPAYSQALNQNKIDRQRSRSRELGRQTVRRLWWMVFGVETGR